MSELPAKYKDVIKNLERFSHLNAPNGEHISNFAGRLRPYAGPVSYDVHILPGDKCLFIGPHEGEKKLNLIKYIPV
jgi:hypothetical protein